MGFLDSYDTFVSRKCKELTEQNSTVEKVTEALGLSNVVKGVEDSAKRGVAESLRDSPLRELAEDVVAQTITDNARRLSQNIMGQSSNKITNTLSDLRSTAFNAVFTTMTLQNDLVLYFASVIAQEAVDAIKDKRRTLIALKESVRKLHNALLTLAGGGPFFNEYLEKLREALTKIDDADNQIAFVQSAFSQRTIFPQANFERAKTLLQEAHELIVPPVTGEDAEELQEGFLQNVFQEPKPERQLGMLMSIPRLTEEMLGNYDLYATKVLKVNALILGFQSAVQNLEEVTGGQFKDMILSHLGDTRDYLDSIKTSMAENLNGDPNAINGPVQVPFGNPVNVRGESIQRTQPYEPNPTKTSSRAIKWGVKVKMAQFMLRTIDAEALQTLSISNAALRAYNQALEDLGELDDRRSPLAVLRATDAREQPGDIESLFITFAFQANQAIVDSSLTEGGRRNFDSDTVLSLGASLNARLQLSIDQDREAERILLRFIKRTEPLLESIRALGDSVFGLLDTLGMDRASDSLKRGAFGEFFGMNGRTATYVGAAATTLSALQGAANTQEQRNCIVESVNRIKVEETSKQLSAQRGVSANFVKQQRQNQEKCDELRRDQAKTEGCAVGFDAGDLRDNPLDSLKGLFRGVFGGDISESLPASGLGNFDETLNTSPDLGDVVNAPSNVDTGEISGVFSNSDFAEIAAEDAQAAAEDATSRAKDRLSGAVNKVEGFEASATENLEDLKSKANLAKEQLTGQGEGIPDAPEVSEIEDAIAEGGIADEAISEADSLKKNFDKAKNVFRTLQ